MADQPTHHDLYERIKAFMLEAPCQRGERIDMQRLADAHRVSITPIREVLYQLVAERLAAPHPAGGFQIALPDAAALQDLHAWHGHHLLAAVHLLPDPIMRRVVGPIASTVANLANSDPVDLFERLVIAIGEASGNLEFAAQIAHANARLHRARVAEGKLFPDRLKELASIVKTNGFDVRQNVRRRLLAYHRRRVEHAAQIAALIG